MEPIDWHLTHISSKNSSNGCSASSCMKISLYAAPGFTLLARALPDDPPISPCSLRPRRLRTKRSSKDYLTADRLTRSLQDYLPSVRHQTIIPRLSHSRRDDLFQTICGFPPTPTTNNALLTHRPQNPDPGESVVSFYAERPSQSL